MKKKKTKRIIRRKNNSFFQKVQDFTDLQLHIHHAKNRKEELLDELTAEKKRLKQIKTKVEHYDELYKDLLNLKDSLKRLPEKKTITVLTKEIERLESLLTRQREDILQVALENPLTSLEEPTFQRSIHPVRLFKNFKKYRNEKGEFNESVNKARIAEVNFTLVKEAKRAKIRNDGTKHYKAEGMHIDSSFVDLGDKLIRTYYLSDIPAYLSPYVLFKLLTSSLPFTISIYIEPTVNSSLIKKARQRLSILEMQQNERTGKGKLRDQQTDKSIEEISAFIEELVHEVEKGILYSFYLSLEAKDKEELKVLHKELKNLTDSIEFTFSTYRFGQKKAFENMLPFNEDHVNQNRILQSTAASYLMPFVTKQIHDPDGIFLGINAYHDSLVFVNPFTVRNSNVNILGVSGAGKSVTAKALATRLYLRGTQVIIIDPEGEYIQFAKSLGGEIIQFSRENGINPFSLTTGESEDEILDHITILKTFFKFFIPQQKYDSAVLDKALMKLYKQDKPSFDKFLKLMKKTSMFEYLNVLNEGSLKGIFNSKRELTLTNDLIVFDISKLGDTEQKAPAMYLLSSLIWQLVNKKSDRKRMLFIDEAHKLLIDRDVAIFYREMVKQARKRNLGVVSITQDVDDFLNSEFGKAVLTNSETKILLKQSYATLPIIGSVFPMTDEEKQQLGNLGIGEVVLFREQEHVRVDIFILPHEEKYILPPQRN